MKKVLMVLSFAMCASVAFAQTSVRGNLLKNEAVTVDLSKLKPAAVDYKASIFSKANGVDTIRTITFATTDATTIGTLASSDVLDGNPVGTAAHGIAGSDKLWIRFADSATARAQMPSMLPGANGSINFIMARMSPTYSDTTDDGFVIVSLSESNADPRVGGHYNTFITLPTVQRPANASMIEVRLTQAYAKYYDMTYIDYQVGGQWYSREINVTGIDCSVNGAAASKVRYTMPHRLNTTNTIALRLRVQTDGNGSAYGYFWAVDNVAICANTNERDWTLSGVHPFDGFYGTMPQGMTIPMTYGINAQNLSGSGVELTNASVNIYAGAEGTEMANAATGVPTTLDSNDIFATYKLVVNERGFFCDTCVLDHGYHTWHGLYENYGNQGALVGGYLGRSLPTATSGLNYWQARAECGTLSTPLDTVGYFVAPYYNAANNPSRIAGYRWARDNGVIPAGSEFAVGYTNDNRFISGNDGDNHHAIAGYEVHVRYTTGAEIPHNDTANWVLRGIEFVPSTLGPLSNLIGARIMPLIYEEVYEETSVRFMPLSLGIDGMSYTVTADDVNDMSDGGYLMPTDNYNAITVKFPEEVTLKANTGYRFGYRLVRDKFFALAATTNSYLNTEDSTYVRFSNNPETAPYQVVFGPTCYNDIFVNDPNNQERSITAWNIDNYPMVRPIVGEPSPVVYATVNVDASSANDTTGFCITYRDEQVCSQNVSWQVVSGSSQAFYFTYPEGDEHSRIEKVIVNGVELLPYDEEDESGDLITLDSNYSVLNELGQQVVERSAYVYYMPEITGDENEIKVIVSWQPWHVGIDPVAEHVALSMAPNPATSSVKLNISGVTGSVNCNIIDMSGRVVYNANIIAENENTINVSSLPAGAYFVRITNDTFSKIEKLIIK